MTDVFTPDFRRSLMRSIRSQNTKVERIVFAYLRANSIYFQKHYKRANGSPDIALPRKKKAVFIDGDFWHGLTFEAKKDKLSPFWRDKIITNIKRDSKNRKLLRSQGWRTLRVWENEIMRKKTREQSLLKIKKFLTDA